MRAYMGDGCDVLDGGTRFTLGLPHREVREAFNTLMLGILTAGATDTDAQRQVGIVFDP